MTRVIGVALALLLVAAAARADKRTDVARGLYNDGLKEYNLAHFPVALDDFESAYKQSSDPVLLFNIGQCHRMMGQEKDAIFAFKAYLRELPRAPNVAEVQKLVGALETELQRKSQSAPPTGVVGPSTPPATGSAPAQTPGNDARRPADIFTVAVSEFRIQGMAPGQEWLGKSFADGVIDALARGKNVRIVEREFLDKIMAELDLQKSAAIDQSTAARVGRLLGARVFVFGSVSQLGDQLLARARSVSVERGEILDSAEANGKSDSVLGLEREVAQKIGTELAIEAAIAPSGTPEQDPMTLAAYAELSHLRQIAAGIPLFGLDPARRRRLPEYQLALASCERLLAEHPRLQPAHFYRALFELQVENTSSAEAESAIALQLQPDDVAAALLRANVLYRERLEQPAVDLLNRTASRFPDDSRAWYALGRINLDRGQKLDAVIDYLAALQREPYIDQAEGNLRTLVAGPAGAALLAQLAQTRPHSYPGAATFRAFFDGDVPALESVSAQAVASNPRLYMAHYVRGLAAAAAHRDAEAMSEWSLALALRPQFPEVHRELGKLFVRRHDCQLGAAHLRLYLRMAAYVENGGELQQLAADCSAR